MLTRFIEWIISFFSGSVSDFVGDAYDNEYETALRNKYGIAEAWADTEEDTCNK